MAATPEPAMLKCLLPAAHTPPQGADGCYKAIADNRQPRGEWSEEAEFRLSDYPDGEAYAAALKWGMDKAYEMFMADGCENSEARLGFFSTGKTQILGRIVSYAVRKAASAILERPGGKVVNSSEFHADRYSYRSACSWVEEHLATARASSPRPDDLAGEIRLLFESGEERLMPLEYKKRRDG